LVAIPLQSRLEKQAFQGDLQNILKLTKDIHNEKMLQSRLEKQAFQEDENTKLHPSSSRLYQLLQSRLEKQAFQERKDSFFDTVMGKIISSCNPA